ncbi:MAG: hypothetical protein KDC61_14335 [Saprospiraceae bacterium]|nr:hypothetical protein [Saprospiraceae bacterium]
MIMMIFFGEANVTIARFFYTKFLAAFSSLITSVIPSGVLQMALFFPCFDNSGNAVPDPTLICRHKNSTRKNLLNVGLKG